MQSKSTAVIVDLTLILQFHNFITLAFVLNNFDIICGAVFFGQFSEEKLLPLAHRDVARGHRGVSIPEKKRAHTHTHNEYSFQKLAFM